jgi:hypothetical protein
LGSSWNTCGGDQHLGLATLDATYSGKRNKVVDFVTGGKERQCASRLC